jgi:phosphopantetheine adenylyltransferase
MSNKEELLEQLKGMSEEEASHMRLVFAPEWPSKATSIGEIRKQTGTRPMSAVEFDRHFGDLPTDGEG